jgi:hypothetical protein
LKLCVPTREGAATVTPAHGRCKKGYRLTALGAEGKQGPQGKEGEPGPEGKPGPDGRSVATGFTEGELEALRSILPHIRYIASGIGGKPTVQFSGVNVQVVNGTGKERTVTGVGNLVIGYPEAARIGGVEETGSHNLVVGEGNTFTSFGGIDAGEWNNIEAPFASVTGGWNNTASGEWASVTGGEENTASGFQAVVTGGDANHASGGKAAVTGGGGNKAEATMSSVTGGNDNTANAWGASISGGVENSIEIEYFPNSGFAWIGGGRKNSITASFASIFGGKGLTATSEYEAIP